MLAPSKAHIQCAHCHTEFSPSQAVRHADEVFCCQGCQTIYQCLNENGLENFYQLMDAESTIPTKVTLNNDYEFLTDKEFIQDFNQSSEGMKFNFYIDGMECIACCWAIQNIEKIDANIIESHFSIDTNILELKVQSSDCLLKLATFISSLGYKLIPLKNVEQGQLHLNIEKQEQLKRIGITGAILMNMMIYAISVYAGAGDSYKTAFGHIQAALFLPVMLYSAIPFYKGFIKQIQSRLYTIDMPITISIVLGSIISYWSYFQGSDQYYFDSLTTFIFLILSTRFVLYFLYRKEVANKLFEGVYLSQQVKKIVDGDIHYKHISKIKEDDIIQIEKGESLPLDGILYSKQAYLNESLLSGESAPVRKQKLDKVLSGSSNISDPIQIKVTSNIKENSFHNYLKALSFDLSSIESYSRFGSIYSIGLSVCIFLIATALLINSPTQESILKILSLLIVCCPCALGIGMPLSTILKIRQLAKNGIIIKNNKILEQYPNIKNLCFDKTGTLTTGDYQLLQMHGEQEEIENLLVLEKYSEHPIAKYLLKHFQNYLKDKECEDIIDIPGKGPQGRIAGNFYEIDNDGANTIQLKKNGNLVLELELQEAIKEDCSRMLQKFSNNYELAIISGDTESKLKSFCERIETNRDLKRIAGASPQKKQEIVQSLGKSIYIGDGLNDVQAMNAANISISLNASQLVDDVCHVVFIGGNLKKLDYFFQEIEHLHRAIKTNIFVSIIYNIIAIFLVLGGHIGPLAAAILMPLSSLIVVIHSYLRMRKKENI